MKRRKRIMLCAALAAALLVTGGCNMRGQEIPDKDGKKTAEPGGIATGTESEEALSMDSSLLIPTADVTELEPGLSMVRYEGDYGFEGFLDQGGAASDDEVIDYLSRHVVMGAAGLEFRESAFGCSALSVQSPDGEQLFGRNFDWNKCNALIVSSYPENGYASISTVNMDFVTNGYGRLLSVLPDQVRTRVALYAPMDGMNEMGLCVAVLMIQDSDAADQATDKPDITTTTAVRLLLDKAADVEEAVELLGTYDMHASMGMTVHFALSDRAGRSVVVEYINQEMAVTDSPVVTNFYLAEGEKQGIGTTQSHTRYEILTKKRSETPEMDMEELRDAMDSVSKDNFGEFESTEWTICYNQSQGEARYYHRENYGNVYTFRIQ